MISFFFKLLGIEILEGKGSSRFKKATKLKRDTYLIMRLITEQFFRSVLLLVTAALRVIVQWCRTLGNHKREDGYEDQKRKKSTGVNIRREKGARV